MLILTRKLGESINIGEKIKISVLGIHGRQVRIGIDAPSNIVVHREEIYVRIQEENRKASKSLAVDLKGIVNLIKGKLIRSDKIKVLPPEIDYKRKVQQRKKQSDHQGSKNRKPKHD